MRHSGPAFGIQSLLVGPPLEKLSVREATVRKVRILNEMNYTFCVVQQFSQGMGREPI